MNYNLATRLWALFLLIRYSSGFVQKYDCCTDCVCRAESPNGGNGAYQSTLEDALVKMNKAMTPEFFESSIDLKTFYKRICNNVEVRESSIPGAGLGLFARKNLKANSIVSFYPAHALGFDDGESTFYSADPYFEDGSVTQSSSYLHCTDQPLFGRPSILQQETEEDTPPPPPPPVFLDVNPNRDIVDGWVSQMINDGAMVLEKSETGVLDYYRASEKTRNCIHTPFGPSPILATATTRKVKKGEELLTSYGGIYWLGVADFDPSLPEVPVTKAIGAEIRGTANALVACMKAVQTVHGSSSQALETAFGDL